MNDEPEIGNIILTAGEVPIRLGGMMMPDVTAVSPIWISIFADNVARARIMSNSTCMRFDIDHKNLKSHSKLEGVSEYIYADGLREKFGDIPVPDADSSECLIVRFAGDAKTMRVSKSLLAFHSETISTILRNDNMEEKDTIVLRDVSRKTFKTILYIIYYAIAYTGNKLCTIRFIRVGQLDALLHAVNMLGMFHVRKSISDGLIKLLPFYDIITSHYLTLIDYMIPHLRRFTGDRFLDNQHPVRLICVCGNACNGITCAKIEDEEVRKLFDGPPGKYAIEDMSTLIHILDNHAMYDVIDACLKHVINADSFRQLSTPNGAFMMLENTEDNPFSAKTYSMIIGRLMDVYREHDRVCNPAVAKKNTYGGMNPRYQFD